MKKLSTFDLKSIALSGGGLTLDASLYSTFDLKSIALSAKSKQARIHIMNASVKSTFDLKSIALSGNGCVSFEF